MKWPVILYFLFIAPSLLAQNLQISFVNADDNYYVDSIRAINLRTGESVLCDIDKNLILEDVSGVELEEFYSTDLQIYPNPSNGKSSFQYSSKIVDNYLIELYNQHGQLIISELANMGIETAVFEMKVKQPGVYILSITGSNERISKQFVVADSESLVDEICFVGNSPDMNKKKEKSGTDDPSLAFLLGDEIRYHCYSDVWKTLMQDQPNESKEINISIHPCIDADRNIYSAVEVGDQVWMGENLRYLPACSPPEINNSTEDKKYFVNGYSGTDITEAKASNNYDVYGALYNWNAAMEACPDGWHLPADAEWKELEGFLGMSEEHQNKTGLRNHWRVGTKLKSASLWYNNGNGSNSCGLNLTPGGLMEDNVFRAPGMTFWTFTANRNTNNYPITRYIMYSEYGVNRLSAPTSIGGSVRCIKDKQSSVRSFDEVMINYEVHGEGEQTVVFVHGWSGNLSSWDDIVPYFKDNYKVVCIDLAGFGQSGRDRSEWTMQNFARDIKAVLDVELAGNAVIIGHSMGGPVAIEAGVLLRESVKGIVIEDILYSVDHSYSDDQIHNLVVSNMTYVNSLIFDVVKGHFETNKEEFARRYINMVRPANKSGWPGAGEEFYRWCNICTERIAELTCSVHAINASTSTNISRWRQFVSSFEAKYVSGVGHLIHWEKPDEFSQLLQESLDVMFQ